MTASNEEWRKAEEAIGRQLGFRIKLLEGDSKYGQADAYQVVRFDLNDKDEEVTRGVRPCERETWETYSKLIKCRIELQRLTEQGEVN